MCLAVNLCGVVCKVLVGGAKEGWVLGASEGGFIFWHVGPGRYS